MISEDRQDKAIQVIQQLVIYARKMAYDKRDCDDIAKLLDDIEYLPNMIIDKRDRSDAFESFVKDIAREYNLPLINEIYSPKE